MGEVILKTDIKREPKTLYYCGTDENGFVTLCKARMGRRRKEEIQEDK